MAYENVPLGAIPSPPGSRDYNVAMFAAVKKAFPDNFQIPYNGQIKNQGVVGSCVAYSLAYCREIVEERQLKEWKEFSPGFIYANRGSTIGSILKTEGMIPREALSNLKTYGCVFQQDFPHNMHYKDIIEVFEPVKEGLQKLAAPYRISVYTRINTTEEVKTALTELGPVSAMFPIYKSFYQPDNGVVSVPDIDTEKYYGLHQMTITGWRDDNTWTVLNSWGKEFGADGYCYIPFNYPTREHWNITDTIKPHWAEKYYYYLNKKGIIIHDRDFDEPITRGEAMALFARMEGYNDGKIS